MVQAFNLGIVAAMLVATTIQAKPDIKGPRCLRSFESLEAKHSGSGSRSIGLSAGSE